MAHDPDFYTNEPGVRSSTLGTKLRPQIPTKQWLAAERRRYRQAVEIDDDLPHHHVCRRDLLPRLLAPEPIAPGTLDSPLLDPRAGVPLDLATPRTARPSRFVESKPKTQNSKYNWQWRRSEAQCRADGSYKARRTKQLRLLIRAEEALERQDMSPPATTLAPLTTQSPQPDPGSKRRRSTSPDAPRKKTLPDPNPTLGPSLRRFTLPDEMSQPLVKYDPNDFKDLPTVRSENPHLWSTRRGTPPTLPAGEHLIYTNAIFPHAHVPAWNFKANVAQDQLDYLSTMEHRLLAVVTHGGGLSFVMRHETQAEDIASFINSFALNDGESEPVHVFAPVPYRTDDRKIFVHPFTYFLLLPEGDDSRLRRFLLWQEVFSIHTTLSFSVHEMSVETPVWSVLVLTGVNGAVVDSQEAKQATLANIKRKLWANVRYCTLVARLVTKNWGIQTDFASRVKAATDTFELIVRRAEQHSTEKLVPAYVLLAKPLSTVREEHEEILACITEQKRYWHGPYALDVNKAKVSCKLCKDTTHCTADCALPNAEGWQGPTAATLNLPNVRMDAKGAPTLQQQAQDIWRHVPRRNERKGKGAGKGKGPAKKTPGGDRLRR